jgi:hypothetical protein
MTRLAKAVSPLGLVAVLGAVVGFAAPAYADNAYTCCDFNWGDAFGPCVAQPGRCGHSHDFVIQLSQLTSADPTDPSAKGDGNLRPGTTSVRFPDFVNGYVVWSTSKPWTGVCLFGPGASEPAGCLQMSLAPGIGAAGIELILPGSWDSITRCFGAPDASGSCDSPGDLNDPTVTAISGSCCLPTESLWADNDPVNGSWYVAYGQEIPGVPPPIVTFDPNGVILPFAEDEGMHVDTYGPVPDRCLAEFQEPPMCGQFPVGIVTPAVEAVTTVSAGGCSMGGSTDPGVGALVGLSLFIVSRRRRAP